MPNDVFPRARKRRVLAFAAAGALGIALAPALMFTSSPASAASPCVPSGYTATSTADLLKLNLLNIGPLGLISAPVADVAIGHASADMAHAQPNVATAKADYLSAAIAGITVPPALLNTHAEQTAPPAHSGPDKHSLIALKSGLLGLGVGNVSAGAGKNGPYGCGIAQGDASVVDATVLPGVAGHSLLALPANLNGFAGAGLSTEHGHLASTANAGAGLANIELLGGTGAAIGVKVITEPTLTGVAGGSIAASSVTYTSPVLDVTLPGGQHVTLDGAHTSVEVAASFKSLLGSLRLPAATLLPPLPRQAHLEIRLSLGSLTSSITKTSVSGSAASLRLQVLLAPIGAQTGLLANLTTGGKTILDLGIGELSVGATAPGLADASPSPSCTSGGYGYGCASPSPCASTAGYGYGSPSCTTSPSPTPGSSHSPTPSPSTSVAATTAGSLPLTGSNTAMYVGGGVLALLLGRFLMVLARRRAAA
jgi:hypothetical protein